MMKSFFKAVGLSVFAAFIAAPAFAQGPFDQTANWGPRGNVNVPGEVEYDAGSGTFTVRGNGDDIWNNDDEGFFIYTEKEGDWRISANVYWNEPGTNDWSKIGVMIREDAASATSRHYWSELRGAGFGDRVDAQWRTSTGGGSGNIQIFEDGDIPVTDFGDGVWLRVSRYSELDLFVQEWSADGEEWFVGHTQNQTGWPSTAAFGIAITSHVDDDFLVEARVQDVKLEEAPPLATVTRGFSAAGFSPNSEIDISMTINNSDSSATNLTISDTVPDGFTISDAGTGTVSGNTITWDQGFASGVTELAYKVTSPASFDGYNAIWTGESSGLLPISGPGALGVINEGVGAFPFSAEIVPYQHATRGNNHLDGGASFENGVYEIWGNGWDIQEGEDEQYFLFDEVEGSFRAEAVVAWIDVPHDWAKLGLMIRETIDPGSVRFFAHARGAWDNFETGARLSQNAGWTGGNDALPDHMHDEPVTFAITRDASTHLCTGEYFDPATNEWVIHRELEVVMPNKVLFGIGVTSHVDDDVSLGRGTISNLTFEALTDTSVGEWSLY